MKIKTITCHDVYNYGASLQAFALQQYLSKLGHDVEIINYIPKYIKSSPGLLSLDIKNDRYNILKKNIPLRVLYNVYRLYIYYGARKRRNAFDRFTNIHLRCTKPYYSLTQLQNDSPIADAYIVGSDQVWNSYMQNGHDSAFYLDFGDQKIRRIAYACSFGTDSINPDYIEFTRKELDRFNDLSVRELSGVNLVKNLGFSNVKQVVDPVFLLSQQEWKEVASGSTYSCPKNYVLIYQIYRDNPLIEQAALYYKKTFGCTIVSIKASTKLHYADNNISDANPVDFIRMILYSRIVLTDSFHATAFSILFQKPFLVYPNRTVNNNARLFDFCTMIECIDKVDYIGSDFELINYSWNAINSHLNEQIQVSKQYIASCLK